MQVTERRYRLLRPNKGQDDKPRNIHHNQNHGEVGSSVSKLVNTFVAAAEWVAALATCRGSINY
jgi:hypothetical protein